MITNPKENYLFACSLFMHSNQNTIFFFFFQTFSLEFYIQFYSNVHFWLCYIQILRSNSFQHQFYVVFCESGHSPARTYFFVHGKTNFTFRFFLSQLVGHCWSAANLLCGKLGENLISTDDLFCICCQPIIFHSICLFLSVSVILAMPRRTEYWDMVIYFGIVCVCVRHCKFDLNFNINFLWHSLFTFGQWF